MMQLFKNTLVLLVLLMPFRGVAAGPGGESAPAAGYGIEPGDLLEISVWNEDNMTREVLVRPDGGISYPLAGDIDVHGRTVSQIQDLVAGRLGEYLPDPVVTVAVRQTAGNVIFIVGKVNRPGPYMMSGRTDVMQALSMAGGTATFAALDDILILRRGEAGQTAIPFDYTDVERGRALEQNILLEAGDIVVVP